MTTESVSILQESALEEKDQDAVTEIEGLVQALVSRIEDVEFEGQSYPSGDKTITPGGLDTIGAGLQLGAMRRTWLSDNQLENLYMILRAWQGWSYSIRNSHTQSD